jgi:hypothetical protein
VVLAIESRDSFSQKIGLSLPADRGKGALTLTAERSSESRQISRLMVFFALVYIVEGLGQTGGLDPLILVSAGSTALILVLVPLLRLGDKVPRAPAR